MKPLCFLFSGLLFFSGGTLPLLAASSSESPPNIVLILADDIGCECFGCYGGEDYKTPNIDELARRGVRFPHCYSQPLCTPSRVKLMTGKSNARNYLDFSLLKPGETTIAQLLQRNGYKTGVFGKWQLYGAKHHGKNAGRGTLPQDAGFDTHCLWQIAKLGSRYWGPLIESNTSSRKYASEEYGPDVFVDQISSFMSKNRNHPFLVYYPMVLTHDPFVPIPGVSRANKQKSDPKNFRAMVERMDANVGKIVATLDDLKITDNTLLIFTTDNGTHKSISSRQLGKTVRGGKGMTTDAGTHVPLVASWPAQMSLGSICNDLVDFSDFYPTLLEASGTEQPGNEAIDGVSFLPQIRGQIGNPRRWIYTYYDPWPSRKGKKWQENWFARNHCWKLYGNGHLYNLRQDPLELHPIERSNADPQAHAARIELQEAIDSMPHELPE